MNLRGLARRARAELFEWSGANARARRRLDGTRAAILYYHRVLPRERAEDDAVEPGMFVTPRTFARQLDWLVEHFRVVPLHEIVEAVASGAPLPAGACAITFDDGWRDNFDHALPELARRGLPATVFVVTERVATDGAFWPDEVSRRWAAADAAGRRAFADAVGAPRPAGFEALLDHLKALPENERARRLDAARSGAPAAASGRRELLDWSELDALAAAGVAIESHGATHAILTGLDERGAASELRRSREQLRERGHGRHDLLAYPSGRWNAKLADCAREQGYRAAFTTETGLAAIGADAFALPRLSLHDDVSASRAEFLFRIPGAP